ncbi:MAG: glycosyltransferase [Thermodesulfovibrionales bacterium]
MSRETLVSVVIPTFNRAAFLPAAIGSVLGQTLRDVEIIVVDDGSTDATRSTVEAFGDAVRYMHTGHKGAAHARNTGMKAAGGKYIAFLDSDDVYHPGKLEIQVAFMEAHREIGMVFTEFSASVGGRITEEYHLRTFHGVYTRRGWKYGDIFRVRGEMRCDALREPVPYYKGHLFKYVLLDPLIPSPTILFPRVILEKTGYQNEAYSLAEEFEFIVRICKQYEVAFLDVPTYTYCYHHDQVSKVNQHAAKEKRMTEVEIQKVLLQAVLDAGYADREFYEGNKDWLAPRLAELYYCLGEKWLNCGNAGHARECFQKGLGFDPEWWKNVHLWYSSFLPAGMRSALRYIVRRARRWTS